MAEKPHAPYIVPGGLKFTYSARPEREGQTHHKKKSRAHKDDLWIQLQRNKASPLCLLQGIGMRVHGYLLHVVWMMYMYAVNSA